MLRQLIMTPLAVMLLLSPLASQSDPLTSGRAAMEAMDLPAARRHLEAALERSPQSYEANWRLALVTLDMGRQLSEATHKGQRDSLYLQAEKYARRAVAANDGGADGHFVLANVLGRVASIRGSKEKIKLASEIKREAERAIAIDPTHHGALHVLGRWHAEIKGLSSVERFMARNFLGGAVLASASWSEAERNLQAAVRYGPKVIYHRLDLAEVLMEEKKWAEAKVHLDAIASLPLRDVRDASYKERARAHLATIAEKLRP